MTKENGIDRVWRYKPIAQSLGISTKTLQRLVARGEIATVQITVVSEDDCPRFATSTRQKELHYPGP
jgi:predicted site-specific integrase-resolvase